MEPKTKTISFDNYDHTRRVILTARKVDDMFTRWSLTVSEIVPEGITSGPIIWERVLSHNTEGYSWELNLAMVMNGVQDLYISVWEGIQQFQG